VLGADVVVIQGERFLERKLQDLLRPRRERDLPGCGLVALADDARDLATHFLAGDVQTLENSRGQSLFLSQEAEENVLGPDVVVSQVARLVLSQDYGLSRTLGEALEHRPSVGRIPGGAWPRPYPYKRRSPTSKCRRAEGGLGRLHFHDLVLQ
jgi:hypothetical protein